MEGAVLPSALWVLGPGVDSVGVASGWGSAGPKMDGPGKWSRNLRRRGGAGRRGWEGWAALYCTIFGVCAARRPHRGLTAASPTGSPGPVAVDSPGPERPRGEPPAYVNIPVSPPSGKQLHYMGLELQEASEGVRGGSLPFMEALTVGDWDHSLKALPPTSPVQQPSVRELFLQPPPRRQTSPTPSPARPHPLRVSPLRHFRGPGWGTGVEGRVTGLGSLGAQAAAHHRLLSGASASLYAQIDIAATEMAHRVGAQHARAREEQLSELEQRKAAPQ